MLPELTLMAEVKGVLVPLPASVPDTSMYSMASPPGPPGSHPPASNTDAARAAAQPMAQRLREDNQFMSNPPRFLFIVPGP